MHYAAPIPKRFDVTYERVPLSRMPDAVQAYIEWFPNRADAPPDDVVISPVGKGLGLFGPPGRGKTTVACWTALHLHAQHKTSVGYITASKFQRAFLKTMTLEKMLSSGSLPDDLSRERVTEYDNIVNWRDWLASRCELLVLDDLGKEHSTQTRFIEDQLDWFLRQRYDEGLPTLVTTNLTKRDVGTRYGDSMASFLFEAFPPVVLDGESWRVPS